jgi:GT2 family glycosyltransferase
MTQIYSALEKKLTVAVIIVSWNRKNLLKRCLLSLDAHLRLSHSVIIIDNASTDGTPEMVRSRFPDVILIENDRNLGFSKAVNQGITLLNQHHFPADFVLLLNNDAYFEDDSIAGMLAHMDQREDVQAAIPAVFGKENRLETGVGGYDLSLKTAFSYFSGLSILFPTVFKGFFIHQGYFYRKKIILEMDWISGVCLALKTGLIGSILRLPEDFFMYAEDTAFCREIRRKGKIIYYPNATVIHTHDGYEDVEKPVNPALWISSLFRYYQDKESQSPVAVKLSLLKLVFMGGFFLRWIGYSLFPISRRRHRVQAPKFRLYCLYIAKNLFARTTR